TTSATPSSRQIRHLTVLTAGALDPASSRFSTPREGLSGHPARHVPKHWMLPRARTTRPRRHAWTIRYSRDGGAPELREREERQHRTDDEVHPLTRGHLTGSLAQAQ